MQQCRQSKLGILQHAASQTRFDIIFSTQRLAEFNNAPTSMAFECIDRHYRYLAKDVIQPLVYPKFMDMKGKSTISFQLTPTNTISLQVPNHIALFSDSEFARSLQNRCTWYCTVFTICNVIHLHLNSYVIYERLLMRRN